MKRARHQAILDLIEKHPIDRQEELLSYLRAGGVDVTQAHGPRGTPRPPPPELSASCAWSRPPPAAAATAMSRRRNRAKSAIRPAGSRPSSVNRCSRWTMPGTWCWSSAFPAWPTPPAKCSTVAAGQRGGHAFRRRYLLYPDAHRGSRPRHLRRTAQLHAAPLTHSRKRGGDTAC